MILGVITAIGGGLILAYAPDYRFEGSVVCMLLIFAIRAAVIRGVCRSPSGP